MPLEQGKSRAAVSHNIATEIRHGHPQKQAVAIAMRTAGIPKSSGDAASVEVIGGADPEEGGLVVIPAQPYVLPGGAPQRVNAAPGAPLPPMQNTGGMPMTPGPVPVLDVGGRSWNTGTETGYEIGTTDEHVGFKAIEKKAAKEYGSEEAGKRVAAAVGMAKYGKAGMEKKAEAGRDAENPNIAGAERINKSPPTY